MCRILGPELVAGVEWGVSRNVLSFVSSGSDTSTSGNKVISSPVQGGVDGPPEVSPALILIVITDNLILE